MPGIEVYEPFKEENEELFGKVNVYMKSDCYMYAPLVIHQPWLRSSIHAVNLAMGNFCLDLTLYVILCA